MFRSTIAAFGGIERVRFLSQPLRQRRRDRLQQLSRTVESWRGGEQRAGIVVRRICDQLPRITSLIQTTNGLRRRNYGIA